MIWPGTITTCSKDRESEPKFSYHDMPNGQEALLHISSTMFVQKQAKSNQLC